jgi:hypothetical protein
MAQFLFVVHFLNASPTDALAEWVRLPNSTPFKVPHSTDSIVVNVRDFLVARI